MDPDHCNLHVLTTPFPTRLTSYLIMTHVEGFGLAVPTAQKEEYRKHAADAAALVKEFGVRRHVEARGDEVPAGKLNDFPTAVQAKEGEEIVFSWFEYPDRATQIGRASCRARVCPYV